MSVDLLYGHSFDSHSICRFEISPAPPSVRRPDNLSLADEVKQMIAFRRRREMIFGDELFADPAWDMLLDLFLAAEKGIPICVSSLCVASACPQTTALRWIKVMEDQGLIFRLPDPLDKRRQLVELTSDATAKLSELLRDRFYIPCRAKV